MLNQNSVKTVKMVKGCFSTPCLFSLLWLGVFLFLLMGVVVFSDHSLVKCEMFDDCIKPKSAYWHFNNTLLCEVFLGQCTIYEVFFSNFKAVVGVCKSPN